ncbi:hypothetical protein [Puniceibacterium sp. IMCC21224]|uniref:hypothetical protein n=1 Tax=Puniceibacterium sp. IMCC21224 TaxID=1618204 RepID=UPI00065D62D6|nr:hypothetical protein [Puniceibacterium sp. IMCC21224]KMK65151.1 hypothetical protein IMCC21224_12396 [Puniceibacterium sp. IMCC21224]
MCAQLFKLSIKGLARGRYTGISDGFHTAIMHAILERSKLLISFTNQVLAKVLISARTYTPAQ